jgi:hypothetical protein
MATKKEKTFEIPNPRKENGRYNPTAARERTTQIVDFLHNIMRIQGKLASLPRGSVLLWVVDNTPIIITASKLREMANQLVSDIRGLGYFYRPPRIGEKKKTVSIIKGEGLIDFFREAAKKSRRFGNMWNDMSDTLTEANTAYTETWSSILDYYANVANIKVIYYKGKVIRANSKEAEDLKGNKNVKRGYIEPNQTMKNTLGSEPAYNEYDRNGKIVINESNGTTLELIEERQGKKNRDEGVPADFIKFIVYRVSIVALNSTKNIESVKNKKQRNDNMDSDFDKIKAIINENRPPAKTTRSKNEILRDYFNVQSQKKNTRKKNKKEQEESSGE